jgi:hypothetical protein
LPVSPATCGGPPLLAPAQNVPKELLKNLERNPADIAQRELRRRIVADLEESLVP